MVRDSWKKGVVISTARDLSCATIKDCAGGDVAYFHKADTIRRLGLDSKENKIVRFQYKRDGPTEVNRVERWNGQVSGGAMKSSKSIPTAINMTDSALPEHPGKGLRTVTFPRRAEKREKRSCSTETLESQPKC